LPLPLEIGIFALLGLIFGSFTTVMIYRIPRELPLGFGGMPWSQCPHCRKRIHWASNIPILSFVMQKGRCKKCKEKISRRYPLVEALSCLLFVATYLATAHASLEYFEPGARVLDLVRNLAFTVALLATVFIDIDFRIIPDRFSIGGWVVGLLFALAIPNPGIVSAVMGSIFGAGLFWLMAWAYEKWKGIEGLGLGDVKMMGWIGAWLGFSSVPMVVLLASVTGMVGGIVAMRSSKDGWKTAAALSGRIRTEISVTQARLLSTPDTSTKLPPCNVVPLNKAGQRLGRSRSCGFTAPSPPSCR
jgi:leader peptidase (prepilin peptidase)/N-methyltransferase